MDLEKYRQVISDAIKGEIEAKQFYEKVAQRIKDAFLTEFSFKPLDPKTIVTDNKSAASIYSLDS